jgi:hypothetical protein
VADLRRHSASPHARKAREELCLRRPNKIDLRCKRVPEYKYAHIAFHLHFFPYAITNNMADINAISKQFTEFYYSTFDSNRANLGPLYVRENICCARLEPHIDVGSILARNFDVVVGGFTIPRGYFHHRETCCMFFY